MFTLIIVFFYFIRWSVLYLKQIIDKFHELKNSDKIPYKSKVDKLAKQRDTFAKKLSNYVKVKEILETKMKLINDYLSSVHPLKIKVYPVDAIDWDTGERKSYTTC